MARGWRYELGAEPAWRGDGTIPNIVDMRDFRLEAFEEHPRLHRQFAARRLDHHEFGMQLPSWISVQPVQNLPLVRSLTVHLGPGEAEAIALAIECSAERLILDDK